MSSKRIFGEHDRSRKTDGHIDRLIDRQQKKVMKRKGKGEERGSKQRKRVEEREMKKMREYRGRKREGE